MLFTRFATAFCTPITGALPVVSGGAGNVTPNPLSGALSDLNKKTTDALDALQRGGDTFKLIPKLPGIAGVVSNADDAYSAVNNLLAARYLESSMIFTGYVTAARVGRTR